MKRIFKEELLKFEESGFDLNRIEVAKAVKIEAKLKGINLSDIEYESICTYVYKNLDTFSDKTIQEICEAVFAVAVPDSLPDLVDTYKKEYEKFDDLLN